MIYNVSRADPVLILTQAFCIIGIVISSLITAVRYHVRIRRHKRLLSDDYAHLAAVIFYWSLCALYIGDRGPMYRFIAVTSGNAPPSAHTPADFMGMMRYNFVVTSFFWAVLWSVKLNLLLLFRKLLRDTGKMLWWWIVFIFTILTFMGCIISEATSCDSYHDFLTLGRVELIERGVIWTDCWRRRMYFTVQYKSSAHQLVLCDWSRYLNGNLRYEMKP